MPDFKHPGLIIMDGVFDSVTAKEIVVGAGSMPSNAKGGTLKFSGSKLWFMPSDGGTPEVVTSA